MRPSPASRVATEGRGGAADQTLQPKEGARAIKGDWWLILNGEDLFRDGKGFKVDYPIGLPGK